MLQAADINDPTLNSPPLTAVPKPLSRVPAAIPRAPIFPRWLTLTGLNELPVIVRSSAVLFMTQEDEDEDGLECDLFTRVHLRGGPADNGARYVDVEETPAYIVGKMGGH